MKAAAPFTAGDVFDMRERTGHGMMTCKRILQRQWVDEQLDILEQKDPALALLLATILELGSH